MTTHPAIRGHSERICSNCGTRPYDHLPHVRITSTSRAQTIITSLERQNLDNRDLVRIAAADEFLVLHFCFLGRVEPIVLQIPATRVSRFVFLSKLHYRRRGFHPPRMPGRPSVERGPERDSFFVAPDSIPGSDSPTAGFGRLCRDEPSRCGATS